jgi:hypothetical protein
LASDTPEVADALGNQKVSVIAFTISKTYVLDYDSLRQNVLNQPSI